MGIINNMGEEKKKEPKSGSDESGDGMLGDGLGAAEEMMDLDNFFPPNDDEVYRSLNSQEGEPVLQQCCCCICNCETKAT